ncbi:MAG TPA: DMT family transporter [Gemmatimonadaceae bacterium]|nr:DMT family transporter [Gemmatimonadaceae bacterium]
MTREKRGPSLLRASLEVVASAGCFGAISIFTVIATQRGGAPLASVLAWRYTLAALALAVVGGGIARLRLPARRALPLVVLGGGGQAAVAFLALSALRWIPAATVGFLFYTFPAWVAIFAAVRRTEPLDARRLGALALASGGIVVLVGAPGTASLHPLGTALALAAAVLYAVYIPLLGRLRREVAPAAASLYVSLGAGLIFVAAGAAAGHLTARLSPAAWGAVAGLALLSTTLGFILFLRGLPVLGPVRTAIISTVEPFWTAVLGALVLAQPLTAAVASGGALVAAAVLLLQGSRARGERSERRGASRGERLIPDP